MITISEAHVEGFALGILVATVLVVLVDELRNAVRRRR